MLNLSQGLDSVTREITLVRKLQQDQFVSVATTYTALFI